MGTVDAVLAAKDALTHGFVVVNADTIYGLEPLGFFLRSGPY